MQTNEVICWLLLCHVVGDFYLQSDHMAKTKGHSRRVCVLHCVQYAACMLIPTATGFILTGNPCTAIRVWLVLAGSHAAIDSLVKPIMAKWVGEGLPLLAIDQGMHVLFVIAAGVLAGASVSVVDLPWLSMRVEVLAWVLGFAFCVKPASVIVRELIAGMRDGSSSDKDESAADGPGKLSAGSTIGMLERLIASTFTALGQYGAIAFVVTAKSIARFKRFESDEDFAEIYLVGTLSSVSLAVLSTLLIRFVLGVE